MSAPPSVKTLRTSRSLLSSLLPPLTPSNSFHASPPSAPSTPLQPKQKPLLLTLHCLFPNELLPALDLLDRSLVTRFILKGAHSAEASRIEVAAVGGDAGDVEATANAQTPLQAVSDAPRGWRSVYYVRSSHQSRSRISSKRSESTATEGISYEVRLQAWSCNCAAFAFAAFSGDWDGVEADRGGDDGGEDDEGLLREKGEAMGVWKVGGATLGEGLPICKHLLACLLAERVEGLGSFVEDRVVSREEMAGWAAGWAG